MNIIFNTISMLLENLHNVTGDWGIAIIFLTLLIRFILLPFSLKQRSGLEKQQIISKKMEEIKTKYKNDKQKMDSEIAKLSKEGAKNMMGCAVTILQIPIIWTLYKVFSKMPMEVSSIIIPWVSSLKLSDTLFIIPVVSVIFQLMPNILLATGVIKSHIVPKPSKSQFLISALITLVFVAKAPLTLGLYWLSSNLFTALEQICYSLYISRKSVNQVS